MTDVAAPLVAIDPPHDAARPRVTVVMSVFNNARHIEQAIESVLSQELAAPFEVIVADDCSTDGTREIVDRYRARFPGVVRRALARHNTWGVESFREAVRAAAAEFVALIDGDDFWTSDDKLQKQVAFLDAHRDCSMCFHNVIAYHENERREPFDFRPPGNARTVEQRDLLERNLIVSCAPMIRTTILQTLPDWVFALELGDWGMYVMATAHGPAGYLDELLGAYRIHDASSWSRLGRRRQLEGSFRFYEEMGRRLGGTHADLIDRQRQLCCQELRIHAWTEWTSGNAVEALRAWTSLAQFNADALSAELAYRFGEQSETAAAVSPSLSCDPQYAGFQERIDGDVLIGWAWNAQAPDMPLGIEILADEQVVATAVADTFRNDLLEAGKGRGYHAFAHRLPEQVKDDRPHRIQTRIQGSRFLLQGDAIVALPSVQTSDRRGAMRAMQVAWLEREVASESATAETLEDDLLSLNRQVVDLRHALETTKATITHLRAKTVEDRTDSEKLAADLSAAREEEGLLRQIDTAVTERRSLTSQLETLREEVENLRQHNETLTSRAIAATQELEALKASPTDLVREALRSIAKPLKKPPVSC